MAILTASLLIPSSSSSSPNPSPPEEGEVDIDQLRKQVEEVLEKNKVTEVRTWNQREQTCIFHAPFLDPQIDYPSWLPSWLKWLWRLWWYIRLPWQAGYPHQWFWDSCAHAIVLSHLDPELAQREIESLLYTQREDGFIPHMVWNEPRMHWVDRLLQWLYPSKHTSPYIQPPALAEAVEEIYKQTGDAEFVAQVLPQLEEYYRYLDRERNRTGDGLAEIIISYESGRDRSPEYDLVYSESNAKPTWRGPMLKLMIRHRLMGWDMDKIFASNRFRVKDLQFNCIYAQNLFALSRLCQIAGDEDAEFFRRKAKEVEESILSKMWDEETGLFYSLDSRNNEDKQLKVSTSSSLMPLILDNISESQVERLVEHLVNPEEFWTNYPIPAVPLSSSQEQPEGHIIWRGSQTWVCPNWYIAKGLRKQAQRFPEHSVEYNQIADELTLKTYELVQREGFCDYYHSETGTGSIANEFSWSTLVLDMVYDMEDREGE